MTPATRPRRAGFSLVELIVVIGVITLLIALLMPALRSARESARTVRCASQLRVIGQGIFAYASNNHGYSPPWGAAFRVDTSGSPLSRGWPAALARYTGAKADAPLYHCPSFPQDDRTVNYFLTAHWEHLQTPEAHAVSLSRVRTATAFLLAAEATAPRAYVPPFGTLNAPEDNTDKDDSGHRDLAFFGEAGGYNMHRAGNNVLFADGHVRPFKRHDPHSITYSPDKMQDWDDVTGD